MVLIEKRLRFKRENTAGPDEVGEQESVEPLICAYIEHCHSWTQQLQKNLSLLTSKYPEPVHPEGHEAVESWGAKEMPPNSQPSFPDPVLV